VRAGRGEVVRVEVVEEGKSPAARRRAGNQKGGMRPKSSTPLTGLGLAPAPAIDLESHDGRMALLAATAEAVATGRCSSATASALVSVVKCAGELARGDQQDQIDVLRARIEALVVPGR
jgi:hypothetical protein